MIKDFKTFLKQQAQHDCVGNIKKARKELLKNFGKTAIISDKNSKENRNSRNSQIQDVDFEELD